MGKLRAVAVAAAILAIPTAAAAMPESTRGPYYFQGTTPVGFNFWGWGGFGGFGCGRFGCGGGWTGWRPDVEFGLHFTGRHDGFVLGFRQAFIFTGAPDTIGGTLVVKFGYDIPIPLKGGKFELNVGPYGTAGFGWLFPRGGWGGAIGPQFGFGGADVKFFIVKGFYAFGRPFEFGMQCLPGNGDCFFQYIFGAGVGIAFPHGG